MFSLDESDETEVTKHVIEPYDFNTSKKKQHRDRIFNCDNIEEMWTKQDKEHELA